MTTAAAGEAVRSAKDSASVSRAEHCTAVLGKGGETQLVPKKQAEVVFLSATEQCDWGGAAMQ